MFKFIKKLIKGIIKLILTLVVIAIGAFVLFYIFHEPDYSSLKKYTPYFAPHSMEEALEKEGVFACAQYYKKERQTNSLSDSIFINDIIPLMENWNYSEIFSCTNEIKYTPAYDYAIPYYCEIRDALVEQIYNDFDDFLEQTIKQYYDDVIPMIVQEANNQFEDDLMSVMGKYEDAKSWYQFWESEDELEKAWKQVIGNKYTGIINGYISQYYNGLTSFYDDYSDIVGCSINLSMDRIEFKFPTPKQIKQYVETENKKWVRDFLIDAGSAAATFTGPAAPYIQAALQGYGNTTTVIEMIKDFTGYSEEQKMIAQIEQDFDYLLCHHLNTPVIKHICTNHILARNAILEQMIKYERYLTIPDSEYTINEIINSIEQQ